MKARYQPGPPVELHKAGNQTSGEARPLRRGLKLHGKYPAGRDPREMTQDELWEVGHEPMSSTPGHPGALSGLLRPPGTGSRALPGGQVPVLALPWEPTLGGSR
jgi:hypothetical protein